MIFINNKYTRIYYSIVENAQTRILPKDVYVEQHHIIPKSLQGANTKDNLVKLTAREHFICHKLLVKMTVCEARAKMIHAFWMMTNTKNSSQYQRHRVSSHSYELARKLFKELRIGKKATPEAIHKNSLSHKGQPATPGMTGKKHSEETKAKMREARAKQVISSETKEKLSKANLGKKHTAETKAKMTASQKERWAKLHQY